MKDFNMKLCLFILVGLLAFSANALASTSEIEKSGKCNLQEADKFDEQKSFIIELKNQDVKVVFQLKGRDSFGDFSIDTIPLITNLSNKDKCISYHIAFFDQNGKLIACGTSDDMFEKDKDKNRETSSGHNSAGISRSNFKKITSYQVIVYITYGKFFK